MNTIKLCGGLGNQLFQYAFGKAQMDNGINVCFDKSWYSNPKIKDRYYALDKFQIDLKLGRRQAGGTIHECGFDRNLLQKDGYNFHGYWQYPAYSEKILPILQKECQLKSEYYTERFVQLRKKIITDPYAVAIHVRRGDYLELEGFPVQSIEYYQRAMKHLRGSYYIFSDDIDWCADNFKSGNFIHLAEYLDFELMRLCKHQIAARSSFSWWAAHLNANPYKVVIIPKEQLTCKVRQKVVNKTHEIFDPKEWIQC